VIDENDQHVYQPGLLFVPFGMTHSEDIVRPRARQFHDGIDYVNCGVEHVDVQRRCVVRTDGVEMPYDVVIIATGSVLAPEETEGLTVPMDGAGLHVLRHGRRHRAARGAEVVRRRSGGRERRRDAHQVSRRSA